MSNMYLQCTILTIYGSFFSHVFHMFFSYLLNTGVFVLRSSISVQVSKKIFGNDDVNVIASELRLTKTRLKLLFLSFFFFFLRLMPTDVNKILKTAC